jgi:methylmalonyl-CoA mutase
MAEASARTRDGIAIEPLYARRRDLPALSGRGAHRWAIIPAIDHTNPDRANAQAHADLVGGANGLSLRFAGSPAAAGFGLPATPTALAVALDGVDLAKTAIHIEPHADAIDSVEWLTALVAKSGVAPELTQISFGLDPVAALARDAKPDTESFAASFRAIRATRFRGPLALLDARPYHEAGASEAQELGAILATAAWWLRALDAAGIAPAAAMPFLGPSISGDRDVLLSIAKLRALRLLWERLQEMCGVPPTPLHLHAETSRRMLTRADPPTNLLRNTIAAFAAGVGGADSITVVPHTAALELADAGARALARNLQHLLIEESHLSFVSDPSAGAGVIEALTDALCERAWEEFQTIEREGGIIESILAGSFQTRVTKARAALVEDTARGATPLVGATIHPPKESARGVAAASTVPAALPGLAPLSLEAAAIAA